MATAMSLFAGAGGECLGLRQAGLTVIGSFEKDPDCLVTLEVNGLNAIEADLKAFDWSRWPIRPDVLAGGPPCQPFSAAGRHKGQADPRDCVPDFVRAVAELEPPTFIMENVKGLTFKKNLPYLEATVTMLEGLGYTVDYRVLNAADYGVPQRRERLFVVGHRSGAVRWPTPTHSRTGEELPKWATMAHALGWDGIVNTKIRWPHERPATTVQAGASGRIGRPGHKNWDKNESQFQEDMVRVTPEEAAVLQDFPMSWSFVGSRSSVFRQIGNACPPRLMQVVVEANLRVGH